MRPALERLPEWWLEPDPRPHCLVRHPPETMISLELLDVAADELLALRAESAAALVARADRASLGRWFHEYAQSRVLWLHLGIDQRYKRPPKREGWVRRATPMGLRRQVFERDGWHCRFCGIPVVAPSARNVLRSQAGLRWGSSNAARHSGLLVAYASHDHVLPQAHGGADELDNLVTACWPCQFSRGPARLDQCGLDDPRCRPPVRTEWDGLTRLERIGT